MRMVIWPSRAETVDNTKIVAGVLGGNRRGDCDSGHRVGKGAIASLIRKLSEGPRSFTGLAVIACTMVWVRWLEWDATPPAWLRRFTKNALARSDKRGQA